MDATQRTGADVAADLIRHSPFARHIGLRAESLEADHAELVVPWDESLATVADVVHGGVISSLIDTAAAAAAWCTPDGSVLSAGTTVGLSVEFLRAARATDLRASARVIKRGRSLSFVDVDVTESSGELVAKGIVTYKSG
jgi:uncharacterized protein (TIGR00369 family)